MSALLYITCLERKDNNYSNFTYIKVFLATLGKCPKQQRKDNIFQARITLSSGTSVTFTSKQIEIDDSICCHRMLIILPIGEGIHLYDDI